MFNKCILILSRRATRSSTNLGNFGRGVELDIAANAAGMLLVNFLSEIVSVAFCFLGLMSSRWSKIGDLPKLSLLNENAHS